MGKTIKDLLTRGVTEVIVREDLEKKLNSKKPLRIKLGIDPTGSRIHIGRAVPLRKLRDFQSFGHKIVLIIGDFTGQVGDASDKDAERPMLSEEKIKENMRFYKKYFEKFLNIEECEIHYNSEWLGKLNFHDICRLADNFSVAEMLDRENFSKRYKEGKRISLREFLYPLMQGYDSVAIKSDIEIGGNDQLFNLLAGRTLQRAFGQEPQNIMTFQLLEGTDGRKMSTSWGNAIYIDDEPSEMFGKVMSIPDTLLLKYFEMCTDEDMAEMEKFAKQDPRNAKVHLAKCIVKEYHSAESAEKAYQDFETKFVKKETPEDIPTFKVGESSAQILDLIVKIAKFAPSMSEARRLVDAGGVSIDGEVIGDIKATIDLSKERVLKVGKRQWARIKKK